MAKYVFIASIEDLSITGQSVTIELNQFILYTLLILKAKTILSSKRFVADRFISGINMPSNSFLYLFILISKDNQLHLYILWVRFRTLTFSCSIDILPPTAIKITGFPSLPYSLSYALSSRFHCFWPISCPFPSLYLASIITSNSSKRKNKSGSTKFTFSMSPPLAFHLGQNSYESKRPEMFFIPSL